MLDTNVISEFAHRDIDGSVLKWINMSPAEYFFVSTISIAEIRYGLERLPTGRKRAALEVSMQTIVETLFESRALSFDASSARIYGERMAAARKAGAAVSMADGMIGATALRHGFKVATRDTAPFEALHVSVINPWMHDDER